MQVGIPLTVLCASVRGHCGCVYVDSGNGVGSGIEGIMGKRHGSGQGGGLTGMHLTYSVMQAFHLPNHLVHLAL